jgi:hypothetical protein
MPPELTTLALGEEDITTTLATGEEEPVTGLTTFQVGEEYLPTQALGEDGPSTRMYGEEGEHIPDTGVENPFGGF